MIPAPRGLVAKARRGDLPGGPRNSPARSEETVS